MYSSIIKTCLCLFGAIAFQSICAQTLIVKSVSLQPNDMTAIEQPYILNKDTCALLKIKTDNLEGIEFPNSNQYAKADYSAGIYYVYIPVTVGKKLDLIHKDYVPLQIDMSDWGYKILRKGKTYLITLEAPKKMDLKSSIIMKVEPQQSKIVFDGQAYEANHNGTVEFPISAGTHTYEVSSQNYHSQKGTVSVGKSEAKTISVRLQPITYKVLVESNVKSARVFVDNIDYGKVGKLLIPQGEHTIRVQADGYVDFERSVIINGSTTSLSFKLKENKRTTHIHPTPVMINSSSMHIYNNNKKIEGWVYGDTIMLMPGKYSLSDDFGTSYEIVVGSEPMTVTLNGDKQQSEKLIEVDIPNAFYVTGGVSFYGAETIWVNSSDSQEHYYIELSAVQHFWGLFALREGISGGFYKYKDYYDDENNHYLSFNVPLQVGLSFPFGTYKQHLFSIFGGGYLEALGFEGNAEYIIGGGIRFSAKLDISKFTIGVDVSKSDSFSAGINLGVKLNRSKSQK